MSGRFVRVSSFRHVHGVAAKPQASFLQSKVDTTGDGNHIASNGKYMAYSHRGGGGGPVCILANANPQRLPANVPKLEVHRGKVLDFAFNPFNDDMLATASDDTHIKVSMVPEGGLTADSKSSIVDLQGHDKKVVMIKWHPTASNVIASAGFDHTVKVWDIEAQSVQYSIDGVHGDALQHVSWNRNGSMLGTCCKDKTIRLFDPRDAKAISEVKAFGGSKKSSVLFMDNQSLIATVGFTRSSMRQIKLYDPRNMSTDKWTLDIDQSAGVLIPYYDYDNSILYIGGKGDSSIKYWEVVKDSPFLHYLSAYSDNQSQKGLCFLPKTSCDTKTCEVASALRVMRDAIIPVHFRVPRKNENFQADLFPDTAAGIASQTSAEYFAGGNSDPTLTSLRPGERRGQEAGELVVKKSYAELEAELAAALKRIAELEAAQ